MEDTCARAVALGLPSVAFTEHVDFTPFRAGSLVSGFLDLVSNDILTAPDLDVDGYFEWIGRCRSRFPELVVLSGMEVGQPHRHNDRVRTLLARGAFDRVVGSLHCLPDGEAYAEPFVLFDSRPATDLFTEYLAEISRMVTGSDAFETVAHIDYPVRSWPDDAAPFDPHNFEDEIRIALRAIAASERALEINTKLPLDPTFVGWWREEGGRAVTFGSDAHEAQLVGTGLAEAGRLATAFGFAPQAQPAAPWVLRS